jgi:tRNA pseudouridine38-40 synthase
VESDSATVPPDKLPLAVARFLPTDLSLFYAEEAKNAFHPRYDVISKEYLYRIKNERIYDPFYYGRAWFLPKPIDDEHIEKMKEAAKYIVGKNDFSSFMAPGSDVTDTVRNVFYLEIEKNGSDIDIRICADGFLYNMVRIIVGTLIEVAYDRLDPRKMGDVIASRDRRNAGMTAPPEGLYLNKVSY